jgi:hypothetical protein
MKHRSIDVRFWSAIVILLVSLFMATPVGAQQAESSPSAEDGSADDVGPRFLIQPVNGADGDYFTLEAEAGTTNQLVVLLANADDEPLSLRTFANDALPVVNGGFAVASEANVPTGPATWLDYPAETFDFEPGQGVERTFTVTIPEDTSPGQYIAGITLETAEPLAVEGTDVLTQIIQKSIAVFIIVPGPEMPAFSVIEATSVADPGVPRFEFLIQNTGNVLVRPTGELTLTDENGQTVYVAPIAMGSVYAGTTVLLSVAVAPSVTEGDYEMSVELTDPASGIVVTVPVETVTVSREAAAPAQFALEGTVTLMPDPASPAYADVAVTIVNIGTAAQQSELILESSRDGKVVETFILAPSLTLPSGETTINQRYIPPTGWEAGTWTFVIRLNLIDQITKSATTVATLNTLQPVEVGN